MKDTTVLKSHEFEHILNGYIEAACWADGPEGSETLPMSDEAMKKAREDVSKFLSLLTVDVKSIRLPLEQIGHDIWLTRNRHGAGFWDRNTLSKEYQIALTDTARKLGECSIYIGDNNELYFE